MCLVSYLPLEEGFLLTSNRDEDKDRAKECLLPKTYNLRYSDITFPQDPKGGTWIAVRDNQDCLVLLNGAFKKHVRKESYGRSRGLIFLELFDHKDTLKAWEEFNLEDIEPFTLCFILKHQKMFELVWDGRKKYTTSLDMSIPHLWMSCTLYSRSEYTQIKKQFLELSQENMNYQNILDFHTNHNYQNIKNQKGIQTIDTVSLTQISYQIDNVSLQYVIF